MHEVRRQADISACGSYRYSLDRKWHDPNSFFSSARLIGNPVPLIFVMLNPSTADAYVDDRTIGRCIGFAEREGYKWLRVINLFAGRATKPADLLKMEDPLGPKNVRQWKLARDLHEYGSTIVCGWGAQKEARPVARDFLKIMNGVPLWCLGVTKTGAPRHPLYLPKDAPLVPFDGSTE